MQDKIRILGSCVTCAAACSHSGELLQAKQRLEQQSDSLRQDINSLQDHIMHVEGMCDALAADKGELEADRQTLQQEGLRLDAAVSQLTVQCKEQGDGNAGLQHKVRRLLCWPTEQQHPL